MTDEKEIRPTVPVSPLFQQIRNPSVFRGSPSEDPSKWLDDYRRIAKFNNWDDMMCLANVYFFLDDTAKQWFENNEPHLNSWDKFKTGLVEIFSQVESSIKRADEQLRCRAQKPGETAQSYIQCILRLCHLVNPKMSEDEKVSHLMKGIAEDFYQTLLTRDINTTDDFIKWCQHMEKMQQKRIGKPKFSRLPNVIPMASIEESSDLISIIRQVVREEVQHLLAPPDSEEGPQVENLETIIREEVQKTLAPISRRTAIKPRPIVEQRPVYAAETQRKTDVWRTEDNRPVCFHCGRPGHVVRYCRDRRATFETYRSRGQNTRPPQSREYHFTDDYRQPAARRSSPSPSRGRSPSRRYRSPSPSIRSPSRQLQGN